VRIIVPTREAKARLGAPPMPMSISAFDAWMRADVPRPAERIRLARMTPA
jgi:hypothetical protein